MMGMGILGTEGIFVVIEELLSPPEEEEIGIGGVTGSAATPALPGTLLL